MRRLVLMRHAKAERAGAGDSDFERVLTTRGSADAALIAQALEASDVRPNKVLVSFAVRTRQTWEAMAEVFPDAEVQFTRVLYHAEPDVILDAVEAETAADTVMVVAHNPGVHALTLRILKYGSAPPSVLARFDRGFPTASAAVFGIDEAGRAAYEGLYLAAELGGGGGE